MAGHYRDFIKKLEDEQLSALCHTTLVRPQCHEHRATFIAPNREQMIGALTSFISPTPSPNVFSGCYRELPRRKSIFIFPEFGVIDAVATQGFLEMHPCFKETLEECERAMQEVLVRPAGLLLTSLRGCSSQVAPGLLPFVQFGIEVALAALWQAGGFQPDAVAGIGMGQVAAWLISGAINMKGAIARIAAVNNLDLTETGLSCLTQSGQFLIDCYTPCRKNVIPELSHLLSAESTGSNPVISFPDIPQWKEGDYFLHGLNVTESLSVGIANPPASLVTAANPQGFWRELARLSVLYNVQWKNFLPRQTLVHRPRYPWQRSRFWLENSRPCDMSSTQYRSEIASSSESQLLLEFDHGSTRGGETNSNFNWENLLTLPESQRKSAITAYLKEQVAGTLRLSAEQIVDPQTFTGLGLDSFAALQLKNRVETDLNISVSLVKLLDGHSIGDLAADLIASETLNSNDASDHTPQHTALRSSSTQTGITGVLPTDVNEISPENVDELLHQLLSTEAAPEVSVSF
jgi:acyl transferase domain-containing protein